MGEQINSRTVYKAIRRLKHAFAIVYGHLRDGSLQKLFANRKIVWKGNKRLIPQLLNPITA